MTASAPAGIVALGTLALSAPVLRMLLEQRLTPEQAAVRCLLALLIVWAGAAAIAALVRTYAAAVEEEPVVTPRRRGEDLPAAPG